MFAISLVLRDIQSLGFEARRDDDLQQLKGRLRRSIIIDCEVSSPMELCNRGCFGGGDVNVLTAMDLERLAILYGINVQVYLLGRGRRAVSVSRVVVRLLVSSVNP